VALPSQPDVFSTGCPLIARPECTLNFIAPKQTSPPRWYPTDVQIKGCDSILRMRASRGELCWLGGMAGCRRSERNQSFIIQWLAFYIRGEVGGEEPNIYLMNPTVGENYQRYWKDVEQVTPVTTSWQPVVIPLSYFTTGPVPSQQVDLSNVQRIQILFEWYPEPTSGRIYIDDLCVQ